jgi:hypothetical protein
VLLTAGGEFDGGIERRQRRATKTTTTTVFVIIKIAATADRCRYSSTAPAAHAARGGWDDAGNEAHQGPDEL